MSSFPLGFEGGMWDLIVLGRDHWFSFTQNIAGLAPYSNIYISDLPNVASSVRTWRDDIFFSNIYISDLPIGVGRGGGVHGAGPQ